MFADCVVEQRERSGMPPPAYVRLQAKEAAAGLGMKPLGTVLMAAFQLTRAFHLLVPFSMA
jgi:hypothetical protein